MSNFTGVAHEMLPWVSSIPDDVISRRQARRIPATYLSSIPARIARAEFPLPSDVATAAEDAARVITRLDVYASQALGRSGVAPLASVLLRSESASSSQIENLTVGVRQLAVAELGLSASSNAEIVAGNVAAMKAAINLADDLDESAIMAMHAALMASMPQEGPGRWREAPVWLGVSQLSPEGAAFVPPTAERIPGCMEDFTAFMRRTDLPALVHAAIAHAQFETIHPFADGNGRTGRALLHAMLRAAGVMRQVTVPVSAGLLTDLDSYVAGLTAFRQGEFVPMVECLADASTQAAVLGRWLVDELAGLVETRMTQVRPRSGSALAGLIYHVAGQPAVTVSSVSLALGVSETAARRAVDQAVDAGVLSLATDKRRNRVWLDKEVIAILNEFAERTGRRGASG